MLGHDHRRLSRPSASLGKRADTLSCLSRPTALFQHSDEQSGCPLRDWHVLFTGETSAAGLLWQEKRSTETPESYLAGRGINRRRRPVTFRFRQAYWASYGISRLVMGFPSECYAKFGGANNVLTSSCDYSCPETSALSGRHGRVRRRRSYLDVYTA